MEEFDRNLSAAINACYAAEFGGSLDQAAIVEALAVEPQQSRTSRYQGVIWRQKGAHGYWCAQPYVSGRGRVYGRSFADGDGAELAAAHDAARIAGWDAPKLRLDNPRAYKNNRRMR
jgi:hypothetical protein